ncbi:hypothetical protein B0T11DRAFT_301479 [Plectosphaerella cucumerina]|uniref:Protein kinase domain-containing protein n=1 Tax=Plectosphaerella cucumerina TaxID=40658 RepID=A0A8K0X0G1_9PEZI|nr:hypothetical protein B0T11DRAFT_301479 [Plectosphaerella cucumerina]
MTKRISSPTETNGGDEIYLNTATNSFSLVRLEYTIHRRLDSAILADMTEALGYLRKKGILYNDIKPGNILSGLMVVVLIDFGLGSEDGSRASAGEGCPSRRLGARYRDDLLAASMREWLDLVETVRTRLGRAEEEDWMSSWVAGEGAEGMFDAQ